MYLLKIVATILITISSLFSMSQNADLIVGRWMNYSFVGNELICNISFISETEINLVNQYAIEVWFFITKELEK